MLHTVNMPEATSPIRGNVYGVAWHGGTAVSPQNEDIRPNSPVLFFKPRNTYLPGGGTVWIPAAMGEVEVCAGVALIFGRDARCVSAQDAFSYIVGYALALDISETEIAVLRPPIREKCRDGFLPMGNTITEWNGLASIADLTLSLEVDGVAAGTLSLREQVDQIAFGIEEISSFMTLRAGDALLAGRMSQPPRVAAGSTVIVHGAGLGRLECRIETEAETAE